tara:strand:- start:386 stop:652 length:267 start_codon:yes stop_codon:yes gene_type:complete
MYGKMKKMKNGGKAKARGQKGTKDPMGGQGNNAKAANAGYVPQSQRNTKEYTPQSQRGKKKMMGGKKKMYREGGSSDTNASYKDFLDL